MNLSKTIQRDLVVVLFGIFMRSLIGPCRATLFGFQKNLLYDTTSYMSSAIMTSLSMENFVSLLLPQETLNISIG